MPFKFKALLMLGLFLIFGVVNSQIYWHENALNQGGRLVLKLQPRDPRSYMQGDYMILNYELADRIPTDEKDGVVYLRPGPNDLATEPVQESDGALKLRYRVRDGQVLFGIESYFFQEGQATRYQVARFVELRVSPQGTPSILHLLDEDFQVI